MIIPYESDYFPESGNLISRIGRFVYLNARNLGRGLFIIGEAFLCVHLFYRRWNEVLRQMILVSYRSFLVTSIVALFTGMILSLQSGLILRDYSQQMRVGTLVAESMVREMGPLMTALILAASVGSSIAAALGTMKVSEEITALEAMSINPVRFLVMPRLVAMMVMCPALTVYTTIIGIAGGGVVANSQLHVSWNLYYDFAIMYINEREIWTMVLKAWVFSVLIVAVSCYQGMATVGGAVGVGVATRRAVVISFLAIIVVGYFITRLMF